MQGFFYNRYNPPSKSEKLGTETDTNVDQQLWYHAAGTSQKEDRFIFAVPEHPTWFIGAEVTDDGRQAPSRASLTSHLHPLPASFFALSIAHPHGLPGASRYLLLSMSEGCEPTNRLYSLDLSQLPRNSKTGALDFTLYDRR